MKIRSIQSLILSFIMIALFLFAGLDNTAMASSGSCKGTCGSDGEGDCWCDDACMTYGDCCYDACQQCGHCTSGSCLGNCGGFSETCYCDTACVDYNDCCQDAFDYCLEISKEDIAYYWAPYHYQDVDIGSKSYNGKADYISRIDFDGNWNIKDNWENMPYFDTNAYVYYSVIEDANYWYIIYCFYHPRDWTNDAFPFFFGEHENDIEGFLALIRKSGDNGGYGNLDAIVTIQHYDFYSYVPKDSPLKGNQQDVDGTLLFADGHHPMTVQKAESHALLAYGTGYGIGLEVA